MFSGKMCTSSATSAPSRSPTVVVPMNLPGPISETLALVMPTTTKLSASLTFMLFPSRDLTVRFWLSSFSSVPRILTGGFAGACANAATDMAASSNAGMKRIMEVLSPGNRDKRCLLRRLRRLQLRGKRRVDSARERSGPLLRPRINDARRNPGAGLESVGRDVRCPAHLCAVDEEAGVGRNAVDDDEP